jgi:hypothetical protein
MKPRAEIYDTTTSTSHGSRRPLLISPKILRVFQTPLEFSQRDHRLVWSLIDVSYGWHELITSIS